MAATLQQREKRRFTTVVVLLLHIIHQCGSNEAENHNKRAKLQGYFLNDDDIPSNDHTLNYVLYVRETLGEDSTHILKRTGQNFLNIYFNPKNRRICKMLIMIY